MNTPIFGLEVDQWLTFIGIIIALGMGILNWVDKRYPNKFTQKIEENKNILTQNQAIDLANKRALDAEIRADKAEEREQRLEGLYNTLKQEFDEWRDKQNYKLVFMVQLGKDPQIESATIFHDRREATLPYEGEDKRK